MIGHIKIDRKILNWEWYTDLKVFHLFLYLLLKAAHKETKWKGNVIKRGQLVFGRLKCSKDTGLTEQNIRTCIDKLKTTSEITTKSTNKFTIITICKYDFYQSGNYSTNQQTNQEANQQLTNNQPTTNQQLTTYNNDNKEKNDNNDKKESEKFVFWESEKNNFLQSGDWIFNFCRGKDIKLEYFDEQAKEFLSDLELKEEYKEVKELKRHFTNWYNKREKDGRFKKIGSTTKNGKINLNEIV